METVTTNFGVQTDLQTHSSPAKLRFANRGQEESTDSSHQYKQIKLSSPTGFNTEFKSLTESSPSLRTFSTASPPKSGFNTIHSKSTPTTPSKDDEVDHTTGLVNFEGHFKRPDDKLFARVKQANLARTSQVFSGHPQLTDSVANLGSRRSSSSSSSSSNPLKPNTKSSCPYNSTNASNGKHLNLRAPSQVEQQIANPVGASSPDLGLGDSDQDLRLRASLPLANYQLLRGQLTEAICVVNSIESLNHDFNYDITDLIDEQRPFLNNLQTLLRSSKTICRQFTVDDNNNQLIEQLAKMKIKKESMEKAISRQLKKTDKLLKKAETAIY